MTKLTDSQLVILSAAAARNDGAVLPLTPSLKLNAGAASLVLKSLIRKGLIDECSARLADKFWCTGDDESRLTLKISDAGLAALGIEPAETKSAKGGAGSVKNRKAADGPRRADPAPRPQAGTKLAAVIALLEREDGASLAELMTATGWQAHSVRGALSGTLKKKFGLVVTSEKIEGRGRLYRIAGQG